MLDGATEGSSAAGTDGLLDLALDVRLQPPPHGGVSVTMTGSRAQKFMPCKHTSAAPCLHDAFCRSAAPLFAVEASCCTDGVLERGLGAAPRLGCG